MVWFRKFALWIAGGVWAFVLVAMTVPETQAESNLVSWGSQLGVMHAIQLVANDWKNSLTMALAVVLSVASFISAIAFKLELDGMVARGTMSQKAADLKVAEMLSNMPIYP